MTPTNSGAQEGLSLLSITNPSQPVLESHWPLAGGRDILSQGNRLFVCAGTNGFHILEVLTDYLPLFTRITPIENGIDLDWYSILGRSNTMSVSSDLYSWTNLDAVAPPWTDPNTNTAVRFYRFQEHR